MAKTKFSVWALVALLAFSQSAYAADNMQQPGTGQWVAADDLGNGVKIPRNKVTFGTDGVATDVDATHGLPVNIVAGAGAGGSTSGFAPNGNVTTPLGVTQTSANTALPAGTTVLVSNKGSNAAYVKLGTSNAVSATTSGVYIPAGGNVGLVVGLNTYLAAISDTGLTTTLNLSGGDGLPTGYGGSTNNGGSTAANQTTANSSLSTIVTNSGNSATGIGAPGDSSCATDTGTCSLEALNKRLNAAITTLNGKIDTLNATASGSLPAGSALVGKFSVDQTTPGTTNGVQDAATGSTGSAVPTKAILAGANSSGNLTGIIQADATKKVSISTATTTEIVALSSGKKIYVTAWDIIANGTGTFKWVYGTGTNCGTGTTDLTDAYDLIAQAGLGRGTGLGPILIVPASNALCAVDSAAVHMGGSVAYTQAP